ncbi:hypothetical protein [Rhodospirillum rubrum]|uniref:hypothetical protein n=1 Tax=Rhodospirillum rubrum TaxID=1085 RepID=UPI0005AA4720|nr:hypothetical protein [Rhodospirillum rubrum]
MYKPGYSVSRRGFLALSLGRLAVLPAACSHPEPPPRFADLRFTHLPPMVLRAGRLDVQESYQSPLRPPNVEQEMPLPPARAARQWAFDRLQTSGESSLTVLMTILDASVTAKYLGVQKGLKGAFKTDQSERYDANLEATVELIDPSTGITLAQASAKVWRHVTVPENASVNDRDSAWFSLIEQLMGDFNNQMESSIRSYMVNYLSPRTFG